jgi:hypothetical protein
MMNEMSTRHRQVLTKDGGSAQRPKIREEIWYGKPPSTEIGMMGVFELQLIAIFLIFRLFLSVRWGGLIAS